MPWNVKQHVEDFRRGFRTKGSFTQNLAITFSGNVMAQVIGFAFTPFIARIYGPEAYGVFALFIAVVNNLSPLSTLQFPSGYVATKDDGEFYRIVKITLGVLIFGTTVYSLIVFLFQHEISSAFNITELKPYFFWMPIYFFLMGLDHILLGWNIQLKEFKRGATAKMFSTTVSKGSTILMGLFMNPTPLGIIVGNLLTYPFESIIKLGPAIRKNVNHIFKAYTWGTLRETFSTFKNYAFFVTPGLFVTNLSNQLPVYYFSLAFSNTTVGLFALANSAVNMPLALVINSSTTVFLQKAAETMQRSMSDLKELVLSLYKKLFFVSFLPLAVLAFTSEWIFKIIFGPAWEQSGLFAAFLCIGAVFNVSSSPLSVLFRLMHYERVNFLINVIFLGVKFFGLWIGLYYNNIVISVIGYSLASLLSYVVSLLVIFRMVKLSVWILLRDIILVGILVALIIYFKA